MDRQHQVAQQVVDTFKGNLDGAVREQINPAQYEELTLMISQAIAQELQSAAAMVAKTAEAIRAGIDGPDRAL